MPSCPAITLNGVSTEKYQQLIQTAQSQGLQLTGESGSTQYQGMDFTWAYSAKEESLTIQCTNKPMLIPCSMIETRIRSLIG